jgi:hypothetical protein
MTRSLLAPVLLVTLSGLCLAQKQTEPYSPRDANFSVRFPEAPKETNNTAKSPIGDLKVVTATLATTDGNVYMASYTDFPTGTVKDDTRKTLFEGVREGLKGKEGKVLTETDIEVGKEKLPARELELEKGKQRVRIRIILGADRIYQVALIGTPAFVKDGTKFLESFELTK